MRSQSVGAAHGALNTAPQPTMWRRHLLIRKAARQFKKRASESKRGGQSPHEETPLVSSQQHQLPSFGVALKNLMLGSYLNVLLICLPLSLCAWLLDWGDGVLFALSCIAILPLANLLGDATEEVAMHTNETLGGLLNATFGNATELIVSILALNKGLITVVQTSLLGSILSNTLLVFGCACLIGGLKSKVLRFSSIAATANVALLLLAILGISVPTILKAIGQDDKKTDLQLSYIISVVMLVLYGLYINFQLNTHRNIFDEPSSPPTLALIEEGVEEEEEEEEGPSFSFAGAMVVLAVVTVVIAGLSELLTASIEGTAKTWGLPDTFIGFVLIPVVGNAAEHATAVVMANQGKMNMALAVALGSSTQIALFVIPLMVIIGFFLGQPMDLQFGTFEMTLSFLSSIICAFVVQDGQSNWLEGAMLLAAYFIIAASFYFYKEPVHSV